MTKSKRRLRRVLTGCWRTVLLSAWRFNISGYPNLPPLFPDGRKQGGGGGKVSDPWNPPDIGQIPFFAMRGKSQMVENKGGGKGANSADSQCCTSEARDWISKLIAPFSNIQSARASNAFRHHQCLLIWLNSVLELVFQIEKWMLPLRQHPLPGSADIRPFLPGYYTNISHFSRSNGK